MWDHRQSGEPADSYLAHPGAPAALIGVHTDWGNSLLGIRAQSQSGLFLVLHDWPRLLIFGSWKAWWSPEWAGCRWGRQRCVVNVRYRMAVTAHKGYIASYWASEVQLKCFFEGQVETSAEQNCSAIKWLIRKPSPAWITLICPSWFYPSLFLSIFSSDERPRSDMLNCCQLCINVDFFCVCVCV